MLRCQILNFSQRYSDFQNWKQCFCGPCLDRWWAYVRGMLNKLRIKAYDQRFSVLKAKERGCIRVFYTEVQSSPEEGNPRHNQPCVSEMGVNTSSQRCGGWGLADGDIPNVWSWSLTQRTMRCGWLSLCLSRVINKRKCSESFKMWAST